jgi:hypothetical protein
MELLLNLCWILLAIPAFFMLRHGAADSRDLHRFQGLRAALVFGCLLMVLFPIISATDDLCAMRPEMEESGSRCVLRDGTGDDGHAFSSTVPVLLLHVSPSLAPAGHVIGLVVERSASASVPVLVTTRPGRAPPSLG